MPYVVSTDFWQYKVEVELMQVIRHELISVLDFEGEAP